MSECGCWFFAEDEDAFDLYSAVCECGHVHDEHDEDGECHAEEVAVDVDA